VTEHGTDLTADFRDRPGTAFVVGGSGGLGAAICRELAVRGSDVALTYRGNEDAAQRLAADIGDWGQRAWAVALDLADHEQARASVDAIAAAAGGIHTLVYAAGPHVPQKHLSTVDPGEVRWQLDVDAAGFFAVAQPAIPHLREREGSIVAVTTAATRRFPVRDGLSSIPKAAVEAAVRGFAAEEGRFGVRANTVGPGMLTDGMAERLMASGDLDERALDAARANIAMRRFGAAADIAEAVCFLASSRARFITGQHLDVDGGFTL
jgi:NAD(P)-dependent dehydrogenase (short-subunit alcohol dehydrogenase family)